MERVWNGRLGRDINDGIEDMRGRRDEKGDVGGRLEEEWRRLEKILGRFVDSDRWEESEEVVFGMLRRGNMVVLLGKGVEGIMDGK